MVICDLKTTVPIRIINLYRSFRLPGMQSPISFFNTQLELLKNSLNTNCIVMGDFNLDANMIHRVDYIYKLPMTSLLDFTLSNNLMQVVNFNTWSRIIKGIKKESCLDHVYKCHHFSSTLYYRISEMAF